MSVSKVNKKRSISVVYKKLDRSRGFPENVSLCDLLKLALSRTIDGKSVSSHWHLRSRTTPDDDRGRQFIHHLDINERWIFGTLIEYVEGKFQPLIRTLDDDSAVDVEQMAPPEKKEFLEAMEFWLIDRDHVFSVHLGTPRVRALEKYLRWIFVEKTKVAADSLFVELMDDIQVTEDDLDNITKISIVDKVGRDSGFGEIEFHDEVTAIERVSRVGASIIEQVVGRNVFVELISRIPLGSEIKADVVFSLVRPRRGESRAALRMISDATRGRDDIEMTVETKHGKICNDRLRIVERKQVDAVDDMPKIDAVKGAMVDVRNQLWNAGRLTP